MVLVRKANKEDYLDIANIHFTSWNLAYSSLLPKSYIAQENDLSHKMKMWKEVIAHPNASIWIAHPNASIWIAYDSRDSDNYTNLGFIACFNKGNNYEITALYVLPEYQRLGIGSQLMHVALNNIHDINSSLSLWVLRDNVSAVSFYKKHGFVNSKEINEELYEDTKIIDIMMVRNPPHIKNMKG